MRIDSQITHGVFCYEIKNRFRAKVLVNGEAIVCYVASSCRLSNFLELENKEILLIPSGNNASRTKYVLFAVKSKNSYTLLELSMANAAVAEQIRRRCFSFLGSRKTVIRERMIAGYKTDLYIADTNTIVEVKTVIAEKKDALFPTVHSERALEQLDKLSALLSAGYRVCYLFTSLGPTVKRIVIDSRNEYGKRLKKCVEHGMMLKAYRLKMSIDEIIISNNLEINIT